MKIIAGSQGDRLSQAICQQLDVHIGAKRILALLAELEQAEREANEVIGGWVAEAQRLIDKLHAAMAKVPALIEALEQIRNGMVSPTFGGVDHANRARAREALAAWDSE